MSSLSHGLEPVTRAFLEELNAKGEPPIYELSVEHVRALLADAQSGDVVKPAVEIENCTIPGGPTGSISIRIIRPEGSAGLLPAVMYFHGGGWVRGDKNTHDRLVREIAIGANAAMVFVNYSLSPEVRYPVAVEEAYFATRYVAENGRSLNLDSARLAVAGESSGGNMAAAVTLLAKQRGGPNLAYQALVYPVMDANFDTLSYREFATGYSLTPEAMKWYWNHYLPDERRRNEVTASPLRASIEQLTGLPPSLVITAEFDVL